MTTEKRDPYLGDYLASDDLPKGRDVQVTIEAYLEPNTERSSDKKLIDRAILRFTGKKKGMILSKVNHRILRNDLGSDPAKWIGQTISLCVRYGNWFQEKDVPTIRVVPQRPMPFGCRKHYGKPQPSSTEPAPEAA